MNNVLHKLEQEKIAQRQVRLERALPLPLISVTDIVEERGYQLSLAAHNILEKACRKK